MQAGHQDDGWRLRGFLEAGGVAAEDVDQFVVDDFDDLFGGRERGGNFFADGAGADAFDEVGDDGEVDVGLEEGETDLAEGVGDVLVGDGALAAEGLKGTLEFVAEVFKHTALSLPAEERLVRELASQRVSGCGLASDGLGDG